jgi:hypothetical protein
MLTLSYDPTIEIKSPIPQIDLIKLRICVEILMSTTFCRPKVVAHSYTSLKLSLSLTYLFIKSKIAKL